MIDPWSIGDIRVFILDPWTSPQADGHIILTDIFIPRCYSCVPSLRQGHKSKNETRMALTLHGLVFSRIHFLIIFRQ